MQVHHSISGLKQTRCKWTKEEVVADGGCWQAILSLFLLFGTPAFGFIGVPRQYLFMQAACPGHDACAMKNSGLMEAFHLGHQSKSCSSSDKAFSLAWHNAAL